MTVNFEEFQHLLLAMRRGFLDELPDRCDQIEDLILEMEKSPVEQNAFNEIYRIVHSLKGSGGTHGLGIITAICHQLENLLTDSVANNKFSQSLVTPALVHVDLLRQVRALGYEESPDYSAIETRLEELRQSTLHNRKAGLIAESSVMMTRIYQASMENQPVQLTLVDNGLAALENLVHQPYDFAIIGRELNDLNGIAVISALRNSNGVNHKLPVVLVTSNTVNIPGQIQIDTILARDKNLSVNLLATVKKIIKS